ncbi:uncharacterized protein [Cherax quadricarinatus]|uniref:uncharacterized protein n=1 Tax=Cherax quadricarinatus TaxID=27406 RepID=UPI002378628A|nr:uncharacterized protein LOC128695051 [Cherax quadricarinatus]
MYTYGVEICWRRKLRYPIMRPDDARLVRYLRRMIEAPPMGGDGTLHPQHPPWHNVTSYNATEKAIRDIFAATEGGVFVEVGAQDGVWLSNTWWLEAARGWRGLLVEADPLNYHHLRNSPRTSPTLPVCVTTGLTPTQEALVRRKQPEPWNTTIGMHQRGQTMLNRYATPTDLYLGQTWHTTCYPLLTVLAAAGYKQINLLIFDMAGGGFELLQDFMTVNMELGNPFRVQMILYQDTSLVNEKVISEEAKSLGYTHLAITAAHFLLLHNSLGVALQ